MIAACINEWRGVRNDGSGVLVLLGFPAYLAWRVCALLLRDPGLHIVALVAAEQRERAERSARELDRHVVGARDRFRCVLWVPDATDLGLVDSGAVLWATVTSIVDLTDTGTPCDATLPDSVPTSVPLAARCPQLRRFDFLSSAFVSGDRRGIVAESDFALDQGFKNRWEERLFAREHAVRAASLVVVPTIYRPTFLIGDSRSGEIDRFSGAYEILYLIERLYDAGLPTPMIGRGSVAAPIVPVDYVATAIARLFGTRGAIGRTFHLVDPDAPTVFAAYRRAAILQTGRPPAFTVAPMLAVRLLRSRLGERWNISPEAIIYLNWRVTYRTAESHALLTPVGILPPTFAEYSAAVVEYFADHCDDPRFGARLA